MVAYKTYANALIIKGHGHPLWEPDPGEYAPVDLGDVGYLYNGAFVKLFNASRDIDDPSNRLGFPHGHCPLRIRDVLRQTPLPKAPEYISSEGVRKKGAELTVTAGISGQAGGGFSFECSHQQGALLIMGDVAYREDATNQREFSDYFIKHYRSWLDFADSLGRDLSLSDLIFVDGCDRTSEWACAAWSEKTRSLRLDFVAGTPGIAEGNVSLWGQWDSSESLDKNVGPQPLTPSAVVSDMASQSDAMPIDNPAPLQAPPHHSPSVRLPLSNQCVFVRGFQMGDRITWFKRKKTRIDVGSGFKAIQKPLDLTKKSNNSTSPDSQHLSSLESSSSRRGASRTSYEATHEQQVSQLGGHGEPDQEAEVTCLDIDECNTPAEALIGYIFEHSTAQLAQIHDRDIIDLLQNTPDVEIHDYNGWIRQLAPPVHLDGDVGMFVGTHTMRMSPSGKRGQSASLGHTAYIQAEPPKPPPSPRKEPWLHTDSNDETNRRWQTEDKNDESPAGRYPRTMTKRIGAQGGSSLTNYLCQRYGNANRLSWEYSHIGPESGGIWIVIGYFDRVEYGRASGNTKGEAKEGAARQILVALRDFE